KLVAPPAITLEGAGEEGKVTIAAAEEAADGGRETEDREMIIDSNDMPDPEAIIDSNDGTSTVGIIDSNDREVIIDSNDGTSRVGIIDSNDTPASGVETVMIDTVPLPEKDGGPRTEDREVIIDSNDRVSAEAIIDSNDGPSAEAIIDSNDGTSRDADQREAIGTWPTPDKPESIASDQDSAGSSNETTRLYEKEEPIQEVSDTELLEQLAEQLPEGAENFTDQAAVDIIAHALTEGDQDFLTSTRTEIQNRFPDVSSQQADSLLAASLLKASQSLAASDLNDQPPVPGTNPATTPNLPGTDPTAGGDTDLEPPPTDDNESNSDDQTAAQGETDQESEQARFMLEDIQKAMSEQSKLMQTLSNLQKRFHDTAMALIRNMK
ncbi:MAG: hypothetical protein ACK2TT_11465, partial [Anaerolineales bacterium]